MHVHASQTCCCSNTTRATALFKKTLIHFRNCCCCCSPTTGHCCVFWFCLHVSQPGALLCAACPGGGGGHGTHIHQVCVEGGGGKGGWVCTLPCVCLRGRGFEGGGRQVCLCGQHLCSAGVEEDMAYDVGWVCLMRKGRGLRVSPLFCWVGGEIVCQHLHQVQVWVCLLGRCWLHVRSRSGCVEGPSPRRIG